MSIRNATITFATTFALLLGSMLGMSAMLGDQVEAARQGDGYGVAQTL